MSQQIETRPKPISEYLKLNSNKKFVVPEYQRAYSWDEEKCNKLWQDLEEFIDLNGENPYFFGTIILDCSIEAEPSIIDGQQRTTTFYLLIKALLIVINEKLSEIPLTDMQSQPLKFSLESSRTEFMKLLYKANPEQVFEILIDDSKIKNIILIENQSTNELYPLEFSKIIRSTRYSDAEATVYKIPYKKHDNKYTNFFRNFKNLYYKLKEYSASKINRFALILLNKCQIIEIRSWQTDEAITMFNSLNSTGMPLSDADIISAKLYSKSNDQKVLFNKKWKNILEMADELENLKIANIDSILQQYMYYNRAVNKEYVSISSNNPDDVSYSVTTPGLRRYYTELKKELLEDPLLFCDYLTKISKIWDITNEYTLTKILLKFNVNLRLFFISYLLRFKPEDITETGEIKELSLCLLRLFAILEVVESGYSSKNFKNFLFKENIKLVDPSISIDVIKNDFDIHIRDTWERDTIKELILESESNSLVYLNDYLYAINHAMAFSIGGTINIEHIMPSSGRNLITIRQDANIANEEEFNEIVNNLGNKILLEENINKSISNDWFRTKKQTSISQKTGYNDSNFPIAKKLISYTSNTWTKDDIEIATEKAAERIVKFIFNE